MEQDTLLQIHCKKVDKMSDRTSVTHCKIGADKAIEFDWGYLKITCRTKPPPEECNKTMFHDLMYEVLSLDILTLAVC